MTIEVSRASKKQSPPARGIGSGIPFTLSQQLPRDTMAKCAKSVGEFLLAEGVTFSRKPEGNGDRCRYIHTRSDKVEVC